MPTSIADLIFLVLQLLSFAIIGRALASWFDPGFRSSIGRFLYDVTEPIIAPIRQVVPTVGMFDISVIVALLLIQVLERMLYTAIYG